MSEQGLTSHPTQYRSFRGRPFRAECTQTHNNKTVGLNFTINRKFNLYRNTKHKNEVNLKLQELHYTRAYVINIMVVLIIFPVILQTAVIDVIMLSVGRQAGTLFQKGGRLVGRLLVLGRRSVVNITLISYTTPLRYVRNVAREE